MFEEPDEREYEHVCKMQIMFCNLVRVFGLQMLTNNFQFGAHSMNIGCGLVLLTIVIDIVSSCLLTPCEKPPGDRGGGAGGRKKKRRVGKSGATPEQAGGSRHET